jgi:ATP-dependent DNA ligase
MSLPLRPPVAPQLALSRKELPTGEQYVYEIKLDGFRCLAFVDGEQVFLQSRNGRPLGRYFPELVLPPGRYVLDGEIVVRDGQGREDFDALGQRVHPAASRVARLARETPAVYVAFDLLARDDEVLLARPFEQRREALQELLSSDGFSRAPRGRSPRSARRPTAPGSARAWPRSSARARSTRSSWAGGPARRRARWGR